MAGKVDLKIMHCPTCGEPLKVERPNEPIVCVACCNTIVPVAEKTVSASRESEGFSGSIRVEGIKTSASALAYLEDYFEDYDWDAFAYAQSLSVSQIDALASSLKSSSADDKNTWIVNFRAASVPFMQKINGSEQVLNEAIEAFKEGNLEAYSKFDAYKRIVSMIRSAKPGIVEKLDKYLTKAIKYGAVDSELTSLKRILESIRGYSGPVEYPELDLVPQVQSFKLEKNQQIANALASVGINAPEALYRANQLLGAGQHVAALNVLLRLKGYSNADQLIEKVDKYFLLSDALEICGKLYYYKKVNPKDQDLALYAVENGKVAQAPLIRGIANILTNYANVLYFLDSTCMLKKYDFATGKQERLLKKRFDKKQIGVNNEKRKVYLVNHHQEGVQGGPKSIYELDLATGTTNEILHEVNDILSQTDKYIVYTCVDKNGPNQKKQTRVLNLNDMRTVTYLGYQKLEVEDYTSDSIVYSVEAPDKTNKDLYIKQLGNSQPPILLEKNIFQFCRVMAEKVFYYIGSESNKTMISINPDGSGRAEMPMYISNILREDNGWVYFMRKVGYNSAFCKCRVDGTGYKIIALDIERFVELKNGYLYYIDDDSSLVKIRMDGSNKQELCSNVETVLSVKEDKIVFVSVDRRKVQEFSNAVTVVKSIYAVDFSGEGLRKLAYDIADAKEYDENTVYFTTLKRGAVRKKELFSLDIQTHAVNKLLEVSINENSGCYVATAVYGSYDCPEVWTLRRFRDDTLAKTWYGRAFIRLYYAVSPTLVKWFGQTGWFKRMWQGKLDRMVNSLRAKGVEDTPYEDKHW